MYHNSQIRNDMPNLMTLITSTWSFLTFTPSIYNHQIQSHITHPMPSSTKIHAVLIKMDNTHYAINEQGHITLANVNEYELFKRANRNNIKLHSPTSKIGKICHQAYINRNSI